jgi:tricorn protease
VTVVPVADEYGLRNLAWVDQNRWMVRSLSGGKVAYIWILTVQGGFTAFNRYFYAQIDEEAAIIDERFNGTGMLATQRECSTDVWPRTLVIR